MAGEAFGIGLVRVNRSVCSLCGSGTIRGTVSALMPAATPDQRRSLGEGLAALAGLVEPDPEAWLCTNETCGNCGVLASGMI